MIFIIGSILLILGFLLGFLHGEKACAVNLKQTIFSFEHTSSKDHQFILSLLRRQIANFLVRRDPNRFLKIYKEEHSFTKMVGDLTAELRSSMLKKLTDEFPQYSDFDIISGRDYVLYLSSIKYFSDEDIENHFKKLVRYQALMTTSDPHWENDLPISDDDVKYAEEYVSNIKDTFFKQRFESALAEYRASGSPLGKFERPLYTIYPVAHYAELRRGIHLKDTNEYGLYGLFISDDNKSYESFYRSDATFNDEKHIEDLLLNDRI